MNETLSTREKLHALAMNLWWSWNPDVLSLFSELSPDAFAAGRNAPLVALAHADEALLEHPAFVERVDGVYESLKHYLETPGEFADHPRVAYFCMEYGLHESFPSYSGGLGILAGDHAKAASDLGLPLVTVGLFLRDGYFKQYFDRDAWQQADFPSIDATQAPVSLCVDDAGKPITVTVTLGHEVLHLQAWEMKLGRNVKVLLDSDMDLNPYHRRFLTRRLYQGGLDTRIQQEIILGIGGLRMLRALGHEVQRFHMNEGHCAFLALERLRELQAEGKTRGEAEDQIRSECLFTTHTPVPAGHDRFSPELTLAQLAGVRESLGMSEYELMAYGRVNPNDPSESFTMTVLGLKLAGKANGVSRLNGEVARNQWTEMYPDRPASEVPIGYVTNGIHLPTWTAPHARPFLEQYLGARWVDQQANPELWNTLADAPDEALWQYRCELRKALVAYVNHHTARQNLPQQPALDGDVLTIGFARRFATYKRAPLLFHELEEAIRILTDGDRPIQVIYAGKAHPHDDGGKAYIQEIYKLTQHPSLEGRVVLLENYDMEVGRMLVSGCDVWLNNPRRPYEASGTSGQKVAIHGGLNLSILDGWWPEGFNGENGWAIGQNASAEIMDERQQDDEDARLLYTLLSEQVGPAFYERNKRGLPDAWIARMRAAMRELPYMYSAERMVRDYIANYYH